MRTESLFVYGLLALVTYKALAGSSSSVSTTVIPPDEPLRLVPEPPSLALTIPALRGDTTVNGLGVRSCPIVAQCLDDGVLGAIRKVNVTHCVDDGLGGYDRLGDIFPGVTSSDIASPFSPPPARPAPYGFRKPSRMYPVPRRRGFG